MSTHAAPDWPLDQGKDAGLLLSVRAAFAPAGAATTGVAKIGVAVSGGGDSIALLHLLHRAAPQAGWNLAVATVDHGLRPEAAAEAAMVAGYCRTLGIPHQTLRWNHGAIAGNLMDQARRARSALIAEWARAGGIGDVALGHTADDQSETFLMGLGRAAGLDGLSGMRGQWQADGLRWTRPLLAHSRAELRGYLLRHGIGWVDDPSNEDDHYTRVKARRALAALAPLGITVERLSTSVAHLSLARQALNHALLKAAGLLVAESAGGLTLDIPGFLAEPPDLRRRLLLAALGWIGGAAYTPRAEAVFRVERAIAEGRDATLSGCRIRSFGPEARLMREPRAVAALVCRVGQIWDQRWRLTGPDAPGLQVRALGAEGLRRCKRWRDSGHSRDLLLVTPAVWRGDDLISAPMAGFASGFTAEIVTGFDSFILSH